MMERDGQEVEVGYITPKGEMISINVAPPPGRNSI